MFYELKNRQPLYFEQAVDLCRYYHKTSLFSCVVAFPPRVRLVYLRLGKPYIVRSAETVLEIP